MFSVTRRELTLIIAFVVVIVFVANLDLSISYSRPLDADYQFNSRIKGGKQSTAQNALEKSVVEDSRIVWKSGKPPQTTLVQHSPGFTIFDNLYMLNGTLYIVTDSSSDFPAIRLITSTAVPIFNGDDEVKKREPTDKEMKIISTSQAQKLFGGGAQRMHGVNWLANDPHQFVDHYYHFAAELFFGMWRAYSSLDTGLKQTGRSTLPPPDRFIFAHTSNAYWRDYAKMNQYILHAAFPGMGLEFAQDWEDRMNTYRPWVMDRVVFADRAAAMKGQSFLNTARYAAQAFNLPGSANWWAPVRGNVVEFTGMRKEVGRGTTHKPVITYVSRQGWGRRMLIQEDHEKLVAALKRLEREHGYEVNIVKMDLLTREEQFRLASRTTIMMGVHGNGLTSLIWMNPTPRTTIMEFFYPGGFAFDYEWTSRALGMTHYGFWNDTHFTSPNIPPVAYPEGFQGDKIPIDGEAVARMVVHRLSLNEELDD